jgi:hypothetical protein
MNQSAVVKAVELNARVAAEAIRVDGMKAANEMCKFCGNPARHVSTDFIEAANRVAALADEIKGLLYDAGTADKEPVVVLPHGSSYAAGYAAGYSGGQRNARRAPSADELLAAMKKHWSGYNQSWYADRVLEQAEEALAKMKEDAK